MSGIEIQDGAFQIDASVLGEGLGLEPSQVPELLRSGAITSRCEQGVDEDEGRYRLTFFHDHRRMRVIVDATGSILQRSSINYGNATPLQRGAPETASE
jgi:hypothetical protein